MVPDVDDRRLLTRRGAAVERGTGRYQQFEHDVANVRRWQNPNSTLGAGCTPRTDHLSELVLEAVVDLLHRHADHLVVVVDPEQN